MLFFLGFSLTFFTQPKSPSRKPKIQKKTKENKQNIRNNNNKHNVFKGFRLTIGYGFVFFVGFPDGFYKTNKSFENTNNTKENPPTKKTNIMFITNNNKVFKGFRLTLGYGFVCCFCVFWFSLWFLQNQKVLRENQKCKRTPKKTKQTLGNTTQTTKCLKVSDPPLDMFLFVWLFLVFQKICLVFFGMFGFFQTFVWFCKKNLRENQTNKNKQNISKGESETFKNFVVFVLS